MAVDDKQVLALIDSYQGRFMGKDQLTVNSLAFRDIKAFRNGAGDSANESLAAAEHYLFARHMVSRAIASQGQMEILVLGYGSIKFIAQTNDFTERKMRHNPDRATSKVSAPSIDWGLRGCEDGETDRTKITPEAKAPTWNWDAMKFGGATDAIAEFGKKAY